MKALLVASLLAACGTDPKTISLVVPGAPILFEGKLAGSWQTLTGTYDGVVTTYTLSFDGEFELLLVSACGATSDASELFGTLDDAEIAIGSWSFHRCDAVETGDPITVTGTMIDANDVAVDASGPHHNNSGESGYEFTASTRAGLHDLVTWNDARFAIVHDMDLADGTDLGAISLGTGSSPIYTEGLAVTVDPDEEATTLVELVTRNGTRVNWSQAPEHVYFMPPDQLGPGDAETFTFVAWAGNNSARFATATQFADIPSKVELLPRVEAVNGAADALNVTWTPFADYFTSATARYTSGLGGRDVTVTNLWLERHPGPVAFDELVPGFDAVNGANAAATSFVVTRWNPDVIVTSETSMIFH